MTADLTVRGTTPAPTRAVEPDEVPPLRSWKDSWPQYLAIAPFYVLFLVFGLFPILFSVYLSFTDWNGMGEIDFVGLAQYQYLVADPRFWNAVGNTFVIWLISTVPMLAMALVLLLSGPAFGGALRAYADALLGRIVAAGGMP